MNIFLGIVLFLFNPSLAKGAGASKSGTLRRQKQSWPQCSEVIVTQSLNRAPLASTTLEVSISRGMSRKDVRIGPEASHFNPQNQNSLDSAFYA